MKTNGTNGDSKETNGNGHIHDENDSKAYDLKAAILSKLNKNEDSIICLDKVIEIDSKFSSAYKRKGYALWNLKKYEDAIIFFNKARELNPERSKYYCNYCDGYDSYPRYKCSICLDYDLCEKCEKKRVHNEEHVLYKLT